MFSFIKKIVKTKEVSHGSVIMTKEMEDQQELDIKTKTVKKLAEIGKEQANESK